MNKQTVYIGVIIGGLIGGYIPSLWGAGLFSFSEVLFGAIGSLAGIWVVYKLLG